MTSENGTTKENSRGCEKRITQPEREGLESIPSRSEINGVEPIRASSENREGGNFNRKLAPIRDTDPGKILERLEALESQHLQYVHAHQSRLKARLGESEEAEKEFIAEANQIKTDIYNLVTAQNHPNGNGHKN
ncbi:hypothetical protein VB711_16980 [Cronbergia sp. UHCC 0137]|uniref:hypothetical protein n=1 Tax=Cronbergia sp. UHCC 0137 TaxID=3110239 RepID=UPI002B2148FD|nr:hypothetical protein [Cronbergia sp. UHCC 0137]MEA5619521.1 hypothetical protein [Cronbergia sp. UHCC 0137]